MALKTAFVVLVASEKKENSGKISQGSFLDFFFKCTANQRWGEVGGWLNKLPSDKHKIH